MARQASNEVRGRIISAAFHVFSEKGYRQASIREISRKAGIATGGIYPYFGNKEQLYLEVLRTEMKRYTEGMGRFESEQPEPAMRGYVEAHIDYVSSTKELVNRQFKDYDLAFVKPIRSEFFLEQRRLIESIIRKGADEKVFLVANCEEAAVFVLCLLKGVLYYSVSGHMDLAPSRYTIGKVILDFLKARVSE